MTTAERGGSQGWSDGAMESHEVLRIQEVYAERERTHGSHKDNAGRQRLLLERDITLERSLADRFDRPLSPCRILDVGCGYGRLLGWCYERGVRAENLFGIDILTNRIKIARETYPAFAFTQGNAEQLPYPDAWFDLVVVFTVFSSILDDAMAQRVARNIDRVLARRGAVVWYDIRYPNPWNPAVRPMTKPRIRRLFPTFALNLKSLSLLPVVAHRLGPQMDLPYHLLASIPILRSHHFGLLRPPADSLTGRTDGAAMSAGKVCQDA
jgi:ubiquinone/menaquinone biosynthesis C-methylase UbiE